MHYYLEPVRANLTGCFSREHTSILTINSGDTVSYRTLDAGWGLEPLTDLAGNRRKFEPRTRDDNGHCVIGPIAFRGAKAGMVLAIQIDDVKTGTYGYCTAGGWDHEVNQRLGLLANQHEILHIWELDPQKNIGVNQFGHTVTLRPFMGVMGMPPNEVGKHPTPPPRFCGGNLDCKELTAGTTLYLPIPIDGGFFYVGDGHAAQGDGESSVTAIECPMERVQLTFTLIDTETLTMPRAKTKEGWITFGVHNDLQEATYLALDNMLSLICKQYHVDRANALALASVVVDLRITQIVNGVRGVHAFLPDNAIR